MKKALLVLLALGLAAAARAQEQGPRVQKFDEIERGFWLRTTIGTALALTDHFGEGRSSPVWPPGPVVTLEMGFDLGQIASLHLAVCGQQVVGDRDLAGRGKVPNDSGVVGIMAGGRFNLATTKRLAFFAKAQAGYLMGFPESAGLKDSFAVMGGAGLEYATGLRHFFVGLEVLAEYLISGGGLSLLVTPTIKYTF